MTRLILPVVITISIVAFFVVFIMNYYNQPLMYIPLIMCIAMFGLCLVFVWDEVPVRKIWNEHLATMDRAILPSNI